MCQKCGILFIYCNHDWTGQKWDYPNLTPFNLELSPLDRSDTTLKGRQF
jgi:hypothetical protein